MAQMFDVQLGITFQQSFQFHKTLGTTAMKYCSVPVQNNGNNVINLQVGWSDNQNFLLA